MRKLDTIVTDLLGIYKLIKQDKVSKIYSFLKSYVNYRKPRASSKADDDREIHFVK